MISGNNSARSRSKFPHNLQIKATSRTVISNPSFSHSNQYKNSAVPRFVRANLHAFPTYSRCIAHYYQPEHLLSVACHRATQLKTQDSHQVQIFRSHPTQCRLLTLPSHPHKRQFSTTHPVLASSSPMKTCRFKTLSTTINPHQQRSQQ